MKFWNSYGSEHSANLVMIGHFKSKVDAEEAKSAIDKIRNFLRESEESYENEDRYSAEMSSLLSELKVHSIHPRELDQFAYDVRSELREDKVFITTEESDFSAFLKVLISHDAKIEVYSAHVYTDTGEGR